MPCQRHDNLIAVAFLDLDDFKATHDTLARFSSDKFIAILTDLRKVKDCQPFLERLIFAAATISGVLLSVSATIAVTLLSAR